MRLFERIEPWPRSTLHKRMHRRTWCDGWTRSHQATTRGRSRVLGRAWCERLASEARVPLPACPFARIAVAPSYDEIAERPRSRGRAMYERTHSSAPCLIAWLTVSSHRCIDPLAHPNPAPPHKHTQASSSPPRPIARLAPSPKEDGARPATRTQHSSSSGRGSRPVTRRRGGCGRGVGERGAVDRGAGDAAGRGHGDGEPGREGRAVGE